MSKKDLSFPLMHNSGIASFDVGDDAKSQLLTLVIESAMESRCDTLREIAHTIKTSGSDRILVNGHELKSREAIAGFAIGLNMAADVLSNAYIKTSFNRLDPALDFDSDFVVTMRDDNLRDDN